MAKNDVDARTNAKNSREWVEQQLLEQHANGDSTGVSASTVASKFGRSEIKVKKDFTDGQYDGKPIILRSNTFFYDVSQLTTIGQRRWQDRYAKRCIGEAGARLIVGPTDWDPEKATGKLEIGHLSSKVVPGVTLSDGLRHRLESHFQRAHRLAILDSGTTTDAIAEDLVAYETPDPDRRLNFLRILTNGKTVAGTLDVERCKHEIILLGGALRRSTAAVVGLLAARCLESWLAQSSDSRIADIAIVGTTAVNQSFDMFSDSENESEMKSRLLSSARIRCVCASSKKLMRRAGGHWAFCKFDSRMVDVVITDDGILESVANQEMEKGRKAFLRLAKELGVFVLVGSKNDSE